MLLMYFDCIFFMCGHSAFSRNVSIMMSTQYTTENAFRDQKLYIRVESDVHISRFLVRQKTQLELNLAM
ncbi:Uncharacterized protein APZ42_003409 [Daphnia magna]|uniref:Uncharacterized protein n=1 Tax=Daphnia magna TaxID=35525 RepID=A0A164HJU5_9CRUS|nr:Uncharacterized protein APZ42_003409 [Daphnia magna]